MKNLIQSIMAATAFVFLLIGCQKMDRPALGNYPEDVNTPGGPLKFYAAFDGTSDDPLRNAVDSIRANFASSNPYTTIDGVNGKAVQSVDKKFIKYQKPNDWASTAKSFTISCWYKKDGQTKNNAGGNGPEYIMSFKSNNGHWSGGSFLLMLEGNNAACAVKVMVVDKDMHDAWFTWEGGNTIPGLLDNQWHHLAIVYDNTTSTMKLYINGVQNPIVPSWGGHGDINMSDAAISEMRVGAGPQNNFDSDDWLSSSLKGALDQLRLYGVALTASEVSALYTNHE